MLFRKRKASSIVGLSAKLRQINFSKEFSGVNIGKRLSEQDFEKIQMQSDHGAIPVQVYPPH